MPIQLKQHYITHLRHFGPKTYFIIYTDGVTEGPAHSYKKNAKCQVQQFRFTAILKSMIPLKVQYPLPL